MQQPRVAPRNIQFQETIQIREIPTDDYEEQQPPNQEPLWDPNLSDKSIFKTKSNKETCIIIGFIVGGIVLLGVVLGTVTGVILSQKTSTASDNSLGYNQACTTGSSQCISSQGLSCLSGFCACSSPYSWNTATSTCSLLTYNQACSTTALCNSSLGLNCINNLCQCDAYHAWSSVNNTCILIMNGTLSYGATCLSGSSQCNSSVDLMCTGSCTCTTPKVWNISTCVCPAGTFLNSSNLCQSAFSVNHSCTIGTNQCDSTKSLYCNNSLCQCDYSTKYWNMNYQTCLARVNYSGACQADSDCVPTLICPAVAGVCNCPQSLPDYDCNCANTNYYDPILLQCVNRATMGGSCSTSANYTCLISLYCNAGICACPSGTSWTAGNSTCAATG